VPPAEPLDLGDDEQPHSHADYGANGPRAADVDRTQDAPSEQRPTSPTVAPAIVGTNASSLKRMSVSVRISCVVCS
jgi:hypothetical protein